MTKEKLREILAAAKAQKDLEYVAAIHELENAYIQAIELSDLNAACESLDIVADLETELTGDCTQTCALGHVWGIRTNEEGEFEPGSEN